MMHVNNSTEQPLLAAERSALSEAQAVLEAAFGRRMFSVTVTALKEDARVLRGVVFQFDLKEVSRDDK